jgi:hypothetical protein
MGDSQMDGVGLKTESLGSTELVLNNDDVAPISGIDNAFIKNGADSFSVIIPIPNSTLCFISTYPKV